MSVNRRAFMSGAVAASALIVPSASSAWAAGPSVRAGIVGAVFDRRFSQGLVFADRARRRNIPAFAFDREMSTLWFDLLRPTLRENPGPLIGLTSVAALFCFEQLAWDLGMRVRLRIEHVATAEGFRHFGGDPVPSELARLEAAGPAFGGEAVDVAIDCSSAGGDCTHVTVPRLPDAIGEGLVTWVIAPRARSLGAA